MRRIFKDFFSANGGATPIEYGLIAAIIAIAIITGITKVGSAFSARLDQITTPLNKPCDNTGLHETFVISRDNRPVTTDDPASPCN